MSALAENPRAVIGSNMPPEPTPYEAAEQEIADLYGEASLWLDGKPVESQDQADGLSNLLNMIRAARKRTDEARAAEKKPHDDAAKAVQERYRPILTSADRAIQGCKAALDPWLQKLEDEQAAAAEKARGEAEHLAQLAREAIQSSPVTDLAERARGEQLLTEAKQAERVASKAERARPQAGSIGRAVGLRTTYSAALVSESEAMTWYWKTDRASCCNLLQTLADQDVRAGVRSIPGFRIDALKKAV